MQGQMVKKHFPIDGQEFLGKLRSLLVLHHEHAATELLADAELSFHLIDHDNWNGGLDRWRIHVLIGIEHFSQVGAKLEVYENLFLEKSQSLTRSLPGTEVTEVVIAPQLHDGNSVRSNTPTDQEVHHIWGAAGIRLFMSHVSAHKQAVTDLKRSLARYGVSCFVAHEDIIPSLEWQKEIELALNSMHALCAYLTTDFHQSDWTDQEVGWAMGRGTPVLPLWVDRTPYGFMGKIQAERVRHPWNVAGSLVAMLLANTRTRSGIRGALVEVFTRSDTWELTRDLANLLHGTEGFTEEEKHKLWHALEHNPKVRDTWDARELIVERIGEPPLVEQQDEDGAPF